MSYRPRHACQNAIAWSIMVRELLAGPCTVADIVHETGMRPETVMGYVRALRRQKALYVSQWNEDTAGRRSVAAYRLGDKPDATRAPEARALIKRCYREREKMRAITAAVQGVSAQ